MVWARPSLRPRARSGRAPGSLAAGFGLAPWLAGAGVSQIAVAIVAAFVVARSIANLSKKQIGGYTGDVLGAAQQLAEIAILAALSAV